MKHLLFSVFIMLFLVALCACGQSNSTADKIGNILGNENNFGYIAPKLDNTPTIGDTSATLSGGFTNPAGYSTKVWFEYGTTSEYGTREDIGVIYTDTGGIKVSYNVTSLTPNTTYYFRMGTSNSGGIWYSNSIIFTTLQIPGYTTPILSKTPIIIGDTFISLSGGFTNPSGYSTKVWFEYGTTSEYGTREDVGVDYTDAGAKNVSYNGTGRLPNTTYYFRMGTSNSGGKWYSNEVTVTTLADSSNKSTAIISGLYAPQQIAMDANYIYWTELNTGTKSGYVKRFLKTGGVVVETLADSLDYPFGIAVDGNYVYFTEQNAKKLKRVPLAGGTPFTLMSSLKTPQFVAVDANNVYFTEFGSWNSSSGMRDKDGAINQFSIAGNKNNILAGGLNGPQSIVIDNNNVYWAEVANSVAGAGAVKSVPINGGTVSTLVSGWNGSSYIGLDTDSIYYWLSYGTMAKIAKGGGTPALLFTSMNGTPPFVVDDTSIYWTENSFGSPLKKAPKNGGGATVIATGLSNPQAILADTAYIYWLNMSTFNTSANAWNGDGAVRKLSK